MAAWKDSGTLFPDGLKQFGVLILTLLPALIPNDRQYFRDGRGYGDHAAGDCLGRTGWLAKALISWLARFTNHPHLPLRCELRFTHPFGNPISIIPSTTRTG